MQRDIYAEEETMHVRIDAYFVRQIWISADAMMRPLLLITSYTALNVGYRWYDQLRSAAKQ